MEETPEIPLAVVRWLESVFRDRVPEADKPEHEKNALAGEQRVVRRVRIEYDRQQQEDDDNT